MINFKSEQDKKILTLPSPLGGEEGEGRKI
jgi:hypothetical protein